MEFREIQRFTQWWLWAIILSILGFMLWGIFEENISGGSNFELSNIQTSQWIGLTVVISVLTLFFSIKQKTLVNKSGIKVTQMFFKRSVSWDQIESCEIIKYTFVGYGYRLSFKYGTVYNIKGNIGLALQLKSGSKILIGTQKPEEFKRILENFKTL